MKLLFIFTGGTIGSTLNDNIISADENKAYKILDFYDRRFGIDFQYDHIEPYTELSENNTGRRIEMLTSCLALHVKEDYDGIIITHGTDSLQYSAAAVGYATGNDSIPVCIVSSNRPIEDPASNAADNLRGAIEFIRCGGGRGAFVVYRNDNSKIVRVHRATRIIGTKAYSDDVSSIFGSVYGTFDADMTFRKNASFKERGDEIPPMVPDFSRDLNSNTLVLFSYTGMPYPTLSDSIKYIIMHSYHSGTINTRSPEAIAFFEEAARRGIRVYVTGVAEGPTYEGAARYGELSVTPLKNISPVAAYMKLWILDSLNRSPDDMQLSLSGDVMTS